MLPLSLKSFYRPRILPACFLLALVIGLSMAAASASAGDWPQILGPNRDGKAHDERLLASWPAAGPKVAWKIQIGDGYAGPAIVGSRVILFHRVGDQEFCEARDAATGGPLWKTGFKTRYQSRINPDAGPRCVPLVQGDRVYLFGAEGRLHCVSLATGEKIWSRDVYGDYQGSEGFFGAGSTPIITGDRLLLNVGGRSGAGVVAFALKDGATLWKATNEGASYSSPTSVVVDGQRHVIFATRLNAVSLDPADGKVLFRFPFGAAGSTVTAASPLVLDGNVFLSASYGVGAKLAKIGKQGAAEVWANDDAMSSQYTTSVRVGDYLYGIHGREDYANGELRCLNWRTGEVKWNTSDDFGTGHLLAAGDRLLIVTNDGSLTMAEATPEAFRPISKASLFGKTVRAMPALAHGRLLVRGNTDQGGRLWCVIVGETNR